MITGPNDRDAIVAWIARCVDGKRPATSFGLAHATDIDRFSPISQREFPRGLGDEDRARECADVADELVRQAEGWAAIKSRPQVFSISAHRTDDPSVPPVAQVPFVVTPEGDFVSAEAPDPRDLLGNMQRQNSDLLRAFGSNMQQDKDRLAEECQTLRASLREMTRLHLEDVRERERALSEKAERDMTVEERRMLLGVYQQLATTGMQWLGSQLLQGSDAKMRGLPVTADQVSAFVGALTPDQLALLQPLWHVVNPALQAGMPADQRAKLLEATRAGAARLNGAPTTPAPPPAPEAAP